MKKILALVLAFVLVLVPMTMSVSAADGDDAAILTVGTSADVAAEDPIAIAVSVATEAEDGIAGAQFDIALGDLVYVSTTADAESVVYVEETNTVKFVDASLDGMGDLFTINVTVPADAEAGDTFTPVVSNVVLCKESEELFAVTSNVATYTVPSQQVVEAVLDSTLGFSNRAVSIGDTLGIVYFVEKAKVAAYDHFDLCVNYQKYDASYNLMAEPVEKIVTDVMSATDTLWYAYAYEIGLYEMGLNVTTYIRCYDAAGNYVAYSNPVSDVPADLLKVLYNSQKDPSKVTDPAKKQKNLNTRAIITDMLNMGAEAQTFFGAKVAGSDLSKVAAKDKVNYQFPQTYASKSLPATLNSVNTTSWTGNESTLNKTTNPFTVAVNLSTAPALMYMVKDTDHLLDPSKLKLDVSYTCKYGGDHVISDVAVGDSWQYTGGYWVYIFSKTCLYDSNKTVTANLTYDDAKAASITYSVETYIGKNKANASMGTILTLIGKFGASARAYFETT